MMTQDTAWYYLTKLKSLQPISEAERKKKVRHDRERPIKTKKGHRKRQGKGKASELLPPRSPAMPSVPSSYILGVSLMCLYLFMNMSPFFLYPF